MCWMNCFLKHIYIYIIDIKLMNHDFSRKNMKFQGWRSFWRETHFLSSGESLDHGKGWKLSVPRTLSNILLNHHSIIVISYPGLLDIWTNNAWTFTWIHCLFKSFPTRSNEDGSRLRLRFGGMILFFGWCLRAVCFIGPLSVSSWATQIDPKTQRHSKLEWGYYLFIPTG